MDDVLQNSPGTKTAESGLPSFEKAILVVPDPQPVTSTEANSRKPDNVAPLNPILVATDPLAHWSSIVSKSFQRSIEDK